MLSAVLPKTRHGLATVAAHGKLLIQALEFLFIELVKGLALDVGLAAELFFTRCRLTARTAKLFVVFEAELTLTVLGEVPLLTGTVLDGEFEASAVVFQLLTHPDLSEPVVFGHGEALFLERQVEAFGHLATDFVDVGTPQGRFGDRRWRLRVRRRRKRAAKARVTEMVLDECLELVGDAKLAVFVGLVWKLLAVIDREDGVDQSSVVLGEILDVLNLFHQFKEGRARDAELLTHVQMNRHVLSQRGPGLAQLQLELFTRQDRAPRGHRGDDLGALVNLVGVLEDH